MPVMTPDHERWEEFCVRLEGPEGCDVRRDELNYNTGRCTGLENKPFARAILASMGLTCADIWGRIALSRSGLLHALLRSVVQCPTDNLTSLLRPRHMARALLIGTRSTIGGAALCSMARW